MKDKKLITHKEYIEELENLKQQMLKSQELAEKFPCFRESILRNKIAENDNHYTIGDRFKKMPLSWGVKVGFYEKPEVSTKIRYMTNFKGTHDAGMYVCIYINTVSLYDSHKKYGLEELARDVFYFDIMNSTFYIKPTELCDFMEKLYQWYEFALKEDCRDKKEAKKKALEDQLKALKNTEYKG